MKNKILHILPANTFTIPFVNFINKEFNPQEHTFLFTSNPGKDLIDSNDNIIILHNSTFFKINILKNIILIFRCLYNSRKVILHGLPPLNYYILYPWAFKKSYWAIYGYEIYPGKGYDSKAFKWKKKFVLKRVAGHITHIKGDSVLANKLFKSKAIYFNSPIYLSNVVSTDSCRIANCKKENISYNILVGNSSSPTNNHISIFRLLESYNNVDMKIFCPLSYGNYPDYKKEVIKEGERIFGDKFVPIIDFMSRNEYDNFLQNISIVIFNHNRQEAMGVTISLLGMGKTIYMDKNTTSYKSLKERGFEVFANDLILEEDLFTKRDTSINPQLIQEFYSYEVLKKSWNSIFNN